MIEHELLENNKESTGGLTSHEARQSIFLQYKFSQGSSLLGDDIFDYLHHRHPDWRITDELTAELYVEAAPKIARATLQPDREGNMLHAGDLPIEDFTRRLAAMRDIFSESPVNNREDMLRRSLAHNITGGDFHYLVERGGRPNRVPLDAGSHNPDADPMLSHLCHYGFLGNDTGSSDFNKMFQDVASYARDHHGYTGARELYAVVDTYNYYHDTKVMLPNRFAALKAA
jgi:hypothetical protein